MAIDYRIRYHFAPHPRSGTRSVAESGVEFVTRREDGTIHSAVIGTSLDTFALRSSCVLDFFEELERAVDKIGPDRQRPTQAGERTLARFCLVLAAFEAVWRGGTRAWPPPWFGKTPPDSADDLLALVPDDWVEDVAALGAAFAKRHSAWLGSADAVPNPVFAGSVEIGGADADLIANRCLWEIKTERRPGGMWLYQPLGYALLDYQNKYAVQGVGLLLPRHDAQISWPIEELITRLSGRGGLSLSDLRQRVRRIVEDQSAELREARLARILKKFEVDSP